MAKPILCLDFDGVIHDYLQGWWDGSIYGRPTKGFFEWAFEAQKHFKLVVYSSRSKTEEGLANMQQWLTEKFLQWTINNKYITVINRLYAFEYDDCRTSFEVSNELEQDLRCISTIDPHEHCCETLSNIIINNLFTFAHEKPAAFLTIDDRALTFNGNWNDFSPKDLINFKPWNKE